MNNSEKAAILREIAKAYRRWVEVQESADQKSPEIERATKEAHALAILHYDLLTDVFRNRKLPGPLRKVLDIHLYRWYNNEQVIGDPLSEWEWFTQPISDDNTSFPDELEKCAVVLEELDRTSPHDDDPMYKPIKEALQSWNDLFPSEKKKTHRDFYRVIDKFPKLRVSKIQGKNTKVHIGDWMGLMDIMKVYGPELEAIKLLDVPGKKRKKLLNNLISGIEERKAQEQARKQQQL